MIASAAIQQKYQQVHPELDVLAKEASEILLSYCRRSQFAFQPSRIKSLESLAEKIEAGRYPAWEKLDDLVACTVIVPTLDQEAQVIAFCKKAFDVRSEKLRGTSQKAAEVFRFDSTRLYVRLRQPVDAETVALPVRYSILAEIQIKSALEHAWTVATHDLTFKTLNIDWRRLRLSAQIKAAVEQLDLAILGFERIATLVPESPDSRLTMKRRVAEIFEDLQKKGHLPSESAPKDVSRFVDNFCDMAFRCGTSNALDSPLQLARKLDGLIKTIGVAKIPRSLSLGQFCFGEALSRGWLQPPKPGYWLHISQEMELLYPATKDLAVKFQL